MPEEESKNIVKTWQQLKESELELNQIVTAIKTNPKSHGYFQNEDYYSALLKDVQGLLQEMRKEHKCHE